jgi:hypothetical protein
MRFVQCRICVALAHSKRAHVSPTKNEAGAAFPLVLAFDHKRRAKEQDLFHHDGQKCEKRFDP